MTTPVLSVAIIGDSLSAVHSFNDNWASHLVKEANQMGAVLTVKNWAACGHTFYKAKTDLVHEGGTKTQVQQCIAHGADIVFVALGVNDCLYAPARTQAQIIQDGTDVFNLLRAGLPSAKIVLIAEAPHNVDSLGLVPSSLTNANAVPSSHQPITYCGRANVRVNNNTYFNQAVPASKLAQHQMWGNVITALKLIYQYNFTVNLWKLARMGCHIDQLHLDSYAGMWWAFTVLKWLKENIGNNVLKIGIYSTADAFLVDMDLYYTQVTSNPMNGQSSAAHRWQHMARRMGHWFYQQRPFEAYVGPLEYQVGDLMEAHLSNCVPNRQTVFGWTPVTPLANLITTSHYVNSNGDYGIFFNPQVIGFPTTPGNYLCQIGVILPDGSVDLFEQPFVIS